MMRRLALGSTAFVLALAAVTLANTHNTPPPGSVTAATELTAAPVIVSVPDVGYVAELSALSLVAPITNAPPVQGSAGIWLERSTIAPALACPAPATDYRLRIDGDIEPLPRHTYRTALTDENGGRGFL